MTDLEMKDQVQTEYYDQAKQYIQQLDFPFVGQGFDEAGPEGGCGHSGKTYGGRRDPGRAKKQDPVQGNYESRAHELENMLPADKKGQVPEPNDQQQSQGCQQGPVKYKYQWRHLDQ
jgi:hypothetical protein